MTQARTASCTEIVSCMLEDHASLKQRLVELRAPDADMASKRKSLDELLPLLEAHTQAEEEIVLARALELEGITVKAMEALEMHESIDFAVARLKQSVQEVQLAARINVFCELLGYYLKKEEEELFPELHKRISMKEREEMGMRYREVKDRNELAPVFRMPVRESLIEGQAGRIGYIIAWLLGVPAWILLLIFLIRGH